MNQELELKLQAWVDGELPATEARRMDESTAQDREAASLVAELRMVKAALLDAETPRAVPEGREFYWSKIARQIERESRPPAPAPHWITGWRRVLMPLAGLAVAACVVLVTAKQSVPAANFDEISSTDEAMETMTYHDQSAGLTVVWLQDKPSAAPAADQVDNSVETD